MPKVHRKTEKNDAKRNPALSLRGRNRICKQCKFTCTDLREFLNHQKFAHSQEKDPEILHSISKRRKSSNSNLQTNTPKRHTRTNSAANNLVESDQNKEKKGESERKKSLDVVKSDFASKEKPEQTGSEESPDDKDDSVKEDSDDRVSVKSMDVDRSLENGTVDSDNGIHLINEHDDEDDRLIIAEEEVSGGLKQPTRSGNIQNRTYVCNLCEFSSTSAKLFLHHQKDEHNSDIIIYECDICEYATKYKQKLPRHRKLHFTGKDSMLSGSDLDSSYGDREKSGSFSEMIKAGEMMEAMEQGDHTMEEDDDDIEDEEEDEEVPATAETPEPPTGASSTPTVEKKKRKTRQEVDPGKYFEVLDETGVKYACSRCGNVYKWRKSLNKHWKEKHHDDEMPDTSQPPPGLAKLSQLTHVKYRFPAVEGKRSPSTAKTANRSETGTPVSMVNYMAHHDPHPHSAVEESNLMSSVVMPRFIGPFITDTVPVFPTASTPNGPMSAYRDTAAHMSDAFMKSAQSRSSTSGGEQPIDFSVKKEPEDRGSPNRGGLQIPLSIKTDGELTQELLAGSKKEDTSPVLQCNRCGFIAKTLVDYSSHMTLHLNKRAFKCAECQEHFNGVDELNKHFGENHAEKIHEHKEAIQKIPHGLQQTYHLLKMPLSAIGNISSQDVPGRGENTDSKYLKCSMCSFVAKWPAELQKHAVSHSEERPFVCMVCGSTYKWKWDLVKHFEKSHNSLPNPYKRREPGNSTAPPPLKQPEQGMSLMKSPSGGSLYGSQPSLYPITSTAEALLDTDAFRRRAMEAFSEEEPLRKKRRLSDTDMPSLDDESNEDDSYAKQREMFIMAGARSGLADVSGDDGDSMTAYSGSKMSSVSTLREMENLIPSDDSQSRSDQEFYRSMYGNRSGDVLNSQALANKGKKRTETGKADNNRSKDKNSDVLLPYKCQLCEYRARWPSEITQHMKNHSDEKPYHCPRCSYKSKWKWDVVKHLKRCGGGTIKDVIDTSKMKKLAPPNVTVMPQGAFQHPPPASTASYSPASYSKGMQEKYAISSVAEALTSSSPMMAMSELRKAGYEAGKEFGEWKKWEQLEKLGLVNGFEGMEGGQQPVFRSLINQGLHHCLECPFVANSPAELRRHGVLHSENKPFSCGVCGYSSRWKCDLKKHMKTYNHYDGSEVSEKTLMGREYPNNKTPDFSQDDGDTNSMDDSEKEDRTLFKCSKCPYVTYKKFSYEIHVKTHGDVKKEEGGPSKFKCKQCDHQAQDLSSFLQHKRTHVNGQVSSQSNPEEQSNGTEHSQNDQMSNRTLQKHRRKPVQQFRCPKCPYSCFNRSELEMHKSLHEQSGEESFRCLYCSYSVSNRSLLVQHMKLHPEFDINQYQEMMMAVGVDPSEFDDTYDMEGDDMEDDDEECMMIDDASRSSLNGKLTVGGAEGGALDLSGPSQLQDIELKNSMKQSPSLASRESQGNNSAMKYSCEWCEARFPNVTMAYQHAAVSHPMELREQEMGETPSFTLPTRQNDPYLERQKRLQQKQELQHKQQQLQLQQQLQIQQQQAKQRKMLLEQQQQQRQMQSSLIKNALSQQPRYRPIEPKPAHSGPDPVIQKPSFTLSPSINSMQKSPHDPNNNKNSSSSPASHASTLAAQTLLARAKKSTSPNKRGRSFQCTKCSFTAPNAVTYLRHIERHGSNCRHTCRFCDYSIDRLNLLYQHMKGTHGDMWRGTPEEKISLTSGGRQHNGDDMRSQTPSAAENCDSLNSSFNGSYSEMMAEFMDAENSNDSLSSSMNEWRMIAAKGQKPVLVVKEETVWRGTRIQICTINGKKSYKCPNCMFVSANSSNMAYHVKQHGANKRYQCEKCDFSADSSKIVYSHMESTHPKEPIFIERIPAKVPFVAEGSVSPEENNNSRWAQRASMQILPTCTKCPFKCRTVDQLQKHINMHGLDKKYKCEMCDFSVDTQELLLKHLVVHRQPYEPDLTSDEPSESEGGPEVDQNQHQFLSKIELMPNRDVSNANAKKLTTQSLTTVLSTAIRSSGRLRYRCAGCPYFSYCKNNLIKHRRQHLIKSRFSCQLCDYSATRAFLLAQHMKFHENAMDTAKITEGKQKNFHDIFLDPFDEDGIQVLKNTDIPDNGSHTSSMEDDKDFSDENIEEFEEGGEFEDESNMEEFDEEEMAALERAEFEGFNQDADRKNGKKTSSNMEGNESDDSLSEMDPMALQQQISLNLSGGLMGEEEKIRYSCSMCPYRCNALRSFKCHIHMHGLNKKYICDYCNWSADRLNLLYQHRKVHAKVPGYDPAPEDIVFLNRNYALENESKMQHIDEVLYNNFNKFKKSEPTDGKTTPVKITEMASDGKKLYMCKLCPFTCSNKNNFTYHKSLHKMNARYTCTECSYSVDRWNLLAKHMQLHHNIDSMKAGLQNGFPAPHLGSMKNYEAGSPEVEPQLYFNSGESPPESDSDREEDKVQDLKCSRCPFSTPSKDLFKSHEHQHNTPSKHVCPYCDFSARTENSLLEHAQLHFPSSKLDKETLRMMLGKRGDKLQAPEVPVVKTGAKSDGEPDSTTEQTTEKSQGDEGDREKEKVDVEKSKTKVYVCQYCEREFEGKSLMLQHEKQHLIGSKY